MQVRAPWQAVPCLGGARVLRSLRNFHDPAGGANGEWYGTVFDRVRAELA